MKVRKIVTEEELKTNISAMAEELKKKITSSEVTLVGILRGGIFFIQELMRSLNKLGINAEVEFAMVKKDEKKNILIVDFPSPKAIQGKVVVVVDDLIKSGETLIKVSSEVKRHKPSQLLTATMVLKENALLKPDAHAFSSKDTAYWVGFGMDYQGKFRNLPYIGEVVKEDRKSVV